METVQFGKIKEQSYTMKESSDDGITVRIAYEPRLARVILSDEQAKEIQKYYEKCIEEGSNPEQVEESKRAMSSSTRLRIGSISSVRLATNIWMRHSVRLRKPLPRPLRMFGKPV